MAVQINIKNMKTYTKSIALAALSLALAGSARSADTTVAGKWQGEFDSQIGLQKYTYEFKVDGTNVTGRAIGIRDEGTNNVAITEGKIVKDEIPSSSRSSSTTTRSASNTPARCRAMKSSCTARWAILPRKIWLSNG